MTPHLPDAMPAPQWVAQPVPVWVSELPDVRDLNLLALCERWPERYPFLLESVASGQKQPGVGLDGQPVGTTAESLGRFDILMAFPQTSDACLTPEAGQDFVRGFEQSLVENGLTPSDSALADDTGVAETKTLSLPFTGGWFVYFGYEFAQVLEPSLSLPASNLPLAKWVRIPSAILIDHQTGHGYLVAEPGFEHRLHTLYQDLQQVGRVETSVPEIAVAEIHQDPPQRFTQGVDRIKDYILAGDVFQVNLSRQWEVDVKNASAPNVYRSLRQANPAPFAAYADFGDWQVLSSSPERLVTSDGEHVATRPIAGTRRRSSDTEKDLALIRELQAHPKEVAEHIMLIDLERNDLGRLSQPGSVAVDELMAIETYQYVHHIVSNIQGRLQPGTSPLDIFAATFPGGTITGCPKIRCMEIIAELEQTPREAYTGSLGYINRDGRLDSNILIRTFVQQGERLRFRAGAGIVADSDPEKELAETRHKAKGLLKALRREMR
ncbi:MAG: aminodeoxychorismate synthase component I [Hydrogenovibrio sp.]|uniref:aminodeoxychorismate synthase component I n=1 Tax=Hydrogenovibrio sp. TaxID=2065821 RepID=UPI0028707B4F|nr:aminodeoxychorismate synthase component I [Hydrogenovibrio sp.]MDR9498069.1 aminodeoxychorismate synthase component I [Hydrogenovibrio sp.]